MCVGVVKSAVVMYSVYNFVFVVSSFVHLLSTQRGYEELLIASRTLNEKMRQKTLAMKVCNTCFSHLFLFYFSSMTHSQHVCWGCKVGTGDAQRDTTFVF